LTGGFARKGKEGHVDDSAKERRRQRMIASRDAGWLSDSMKAAFTTGDARDPIISARFLGDLGEELGGVISLSGGTIGDMLPPDFVREAARNAVEAYPHYPGVKGYRDFRQAIAAKLTRENGIEADPDDEILPTIGCQQVIDSAFRILISPGDDVLLMDPEYASTEPAIRMAGGNVIPVPLQWDGTEWRFDFEELARRASPRTKLLVMSNGNNPTGIVFSREELAQIADLAKTFDFWVFSDEEYEKTLFDGAEHVSIATLPGMRERTVSAFSFSKAYGMTAYRIGYSVGPAAFTDHLHSILRFSIQACSAVGQRAAHAVLTNDMTPWLQESTTNLEAKRDELVDRLNQIPGIRCNVPRGVYFVFPDIRGLGLGSVELAEHVLREGRVAVAPGSQFGPMGEGHLRISFCPSIENIREGMDRFERALATLPSPVLA
jgi:aspartate/methionine/tyrosine aminotransferase